MKNRNEWRRAYALAALHALVLKNPPKNGLEKSQLSHECECLALGAMEYAEQMIKLVEEVENAEEEAKKRKLSEAYAKSQGREKKPETVPV